MYPDPVPQFRARVRPIASKTAENPNFQNKHRLNDSYKCGLRFSQFALVGLNLQHWFQVVNREIRSDSILKAWLAGQPHRVLLR